MRGEPSPEDKPNPSDRRRPGLARALWLSGVGCAALVGAGWVLRIPLAQLLVDAVLADLGAPAQARVAAVGPDGVTLTDVAIGQAAAPDLAAERLSARLAWGPLGPRVTEVRISRLRLRAQLDERGGSLGALDTLLSRGRPRPPALPALALDIPDATIELATPYGVVAATGALTGRLDQTFNAAFAATHPALAGPAGAAQAVRLDARARGDGGRISVELALQAGRLDDARGWALRDATLRAAAAGRSDLTELSARLETALDALAAPGLAIGTMQAQADFAAAGLAPGWRPRDWSLRLRTDSGAGRLGGIGAAALSAEASLSGEPDGASGRWSISAADLSGASVEALAADAGGGLKLRRGDTGLALAAEGSARLRDARVTPSVRRNLRELAAALTPTPIGPLVTRATPALDGAMRGFSIQAPILLTWGANGGALWLTGPAALDSVSGARARLLAGDATQKAAPGRIALPSGDAFAEARLEIDGPDLPGLSLDIETLRREAGALKLEARLRMEPWATGGARLALSDARLSLSSNPQDGRATFITTIDASGPLGPGRIETLRANLDLEGQWGEERFALMLREPGCVGLSARAASLAGQTLDRPALRLCPLKGRTVFAMNRGAIGGGMRADAITLTGPAAQIRARALVAEVSGPAAAPRFSLGAQGLDVEGALAPDRRVALTAERIDAAFAGAAARATIAGLGLRESMLPAIVSQGALEVSGGAIPTGGFAWRIVEGSALLEDPEAAPRYAPIRLQRLRGTLEGDRISAEAALVPAAFPAVALGALRATHDLGAGAGEASVETRALTFSQRLDLSDLSPLALGVVANVAGPVDADVRARWNGDGVAAEGEVRLNGVAGVTAGLGSIENVRGTIAFDDLIALTTPPGQALSLGAVNPGVRVSDGQVRFQLLPDLTVALEAATFPFSGGVLSADPAQVRIGAPESAYTLRLKDIDIATFLKELAFEDLRATGTVSGIAPLTFGPDGGRIEGGLLTAAGGGVIAYAGPVADDAASAAGQGQLAFDALREFRYDQLEVRIDGPLDGELTSRIRFQGINLSPVRPLPGLPGIAEVGLPFRFNVSVQAPFRQLIEQAQTTLDPLRGVDLGGARAADPPPQ